MESVHVSDIMTRDPITIKSSTNLLECAKTLVRKNVGSLLLAENGRLVGFISQKDILWALIKKSEKDLEKIKAIDISPKKIATIKPEASLREAIEKMKKLGFERLPVIFEGKLVGMITIKDILSFHPEIYPELDEFAKIREEEEKLKRIKKAAEIREGICEECGNYDILFRTNNRLLCEDCRDEV
ncbi:CBS domain-containing protein [Candidatus Pacearchaeota archaeon]|nr:CBS domain-containing protein [Candidatus Pacearchaeota archaeon]